jgi:integrase
MSKNRILLPNGCSRTELAVMPKNWKVAKKIKGPWRIHYRFYDPTQAKPKQVNIKAMNKHKDIEDRKAAVDLLIETEAQLLASGYNPFLKQTITVRENKYDIEPYTLFIPALYAALERLPMEEKTKKEIKSYIIGTVSKAARHLNYHMMFISEVRRKHIIYILDHIRQTNKAFSDNTFNHFRKYLRILFAELTEIDATESNIINDIKVKQYEHAEREVLTDAQRKAVNEMLIEKHPAFHRFLHIFFHSGARVTELMKVRGADVDLQNQRYKMTVKKGRKHRTMWRTIKNIALPYWMAALDNCAPGDYVFSRGLTPGTYAIRPDQITKRWYRLVKNGKDLNGKPFGIEADFYSLKHLNTTETIDHLEGQASDATKLAAEHNAHTSAAMVVQIYDVKHKEREHNKVKKVNNPFA